MPDGSATAHLLWPKLATTFGKGYSLAFFGKDAIAALTVVIVVLPLFQQITPRSG